MPRLVIRRGVNAGQEHRLTTDRVVLGRRHRADITIVDSKASREHAAVVRRGDGFFVLDLSRNGTLVSGRAASRDPNAPTPLRPGDTIRIGDTELELVDEALEARPAEIPGYTIMERIGAGGMGAVYRARQLSMDRVVALKVLSERHSNNTEFVERFIREARAAGRLNHPNLIHVHDVSKSGGRHYFSMEFVDGESVKELLRKRERMPVRQALDIAIQAGKALEYAHEQGVIHRDVKPDNLMMSREGVVKVADLGIAKELDTAEVSLETFRLLGTPHYMSPEQALGKVVDPRTDIYSLGATLYHLLTGVTPFSGRTAREVLKAHVQESPDPIRQYAPETPEALCFVVERMMAKLPEKRYPHMAAAIEDLERVYSALPREDAQGAPLPGRRAPRKRRPATEDVSTGVHRPVSRWVALSLLAALFLVVFSVGVILLSRYRGQDTNPSDNRGNAPRQNVRLPPGNRLVDPPPNIVGPENPALTSQRDLGEKLKRVRELLEKDPAAAPALALLRELERDHPASFEVKNLIEQVERRQREAAERDARAALAAALDFDARHAAAPEQQADIVAKYRQLAAQLKPYPDLFRQAQAKLEAAEKRLQEARDILLTQDWTKTTAAARTAREAGDFDGAREALRAFDRKYAPHHLKAEIEEALRASDEAALAAFEKARDEARKKEDDLAQNAAAAPAVWEQYLKIVKDAGRQADARTALQDLEGRLAKLAQDGPPGVARAARALDYTEALRQFAAGAARFQGTKWADAPKGRQATIEMLRELHAKVVGRIREQTRARPVAVPAKVSIPGPRGAKFEITGALPDELRCRDLISQVEVGRKFHQFTPAEQYQLYLAFLEPLTLEDHKALALFCRERSPELAKECEFHTGKFTPPDDPPPPPAPPPPAAPPAADNP